MDILGTEFDAQMQGEERRALLHEDVKKQKLGLQLIWIAIGFAVMLGPFKWIVDWYYGQ